MPPARRMALSPTHSFLTPGPGHLENSGSLSQVALANVDTFLCIKKHVRQQPANLLTKSLSCGRSRPRRGDCEISNILIFAGKLEFYW